MKSGMIDQARATGRGSKLWLEIIKIFFVTMLTLMTVAGFASWIEKSPLVPADGDIVSIIYLWSEALSIALLLLYCRFVEKRPISSVGFVKRNVWKQYLTGAAVGFGMFLLVVLIGTVIGAFRFRGINDSIDPGILLLFLGGFLVQGMSEEVLCRGYIMVSVARKNSVVSGVIVNSVVFMLLHAVNGGFGALPCVNLLLFSVLTSFYALKEDSLWGVGAMHSIWNFVQGNFFGLSVSGSELTATVFMFESTDMTLANGGAFGPEGGLIVTAVLSAALIAMLVQYNKAKAQN